MSLSGSMKMHDRTREPKPPAPILQDDDQPLGDGPCDGYEAGLLLRWHGLEAVESICERVSRFGGRPISR
jgi:hypothetical protein